MKTNQLTRSNSVQGREVGNPIKLKGIHTPLVPSLVDTKSIILVCDGEENCGMSNFAVKISKFGKELLEEQSK